MTPKKRLLDHDPSRTLSEPKLVFAAFIECLKAGDSESALEVLAASLRHLNKSAIERKYHIPRRTVYNLLDKKSVPGLDVVAKVCLAIEREAVKKLPRAAA